MYEGIKVVKPTSEYYEAVDKAVRKQDNLKIDYDQLAEEYNAVEEGSIILIKRSYTVKLGNLARILQGRGAIRDLDYTLVRLKFSSDGACIPAGKRPIAIKKLTPTQLRKVQ